MNGRTTKLLRKVFKDRKTYKRAKHAYAHSNLKEKLKAKDDIQEILESGVKVRQIK